MGRYRNSRPEVFCKNGVLRNFAKFTGKHLYQSLFFNKVLRPATLLKKRLWHRYFSVNFAKLLRTPRTPLVAASRDTGKRQQQPLKVFCKKGVPKNFTSFTGKHLCSNLVLIRLRLQKRDSNRFQRRCFPVKFAKFLKTSNCCH